MYPGQFDMFHDRRHKGITAVGNCISLSFDSILEKFIDENGAFRRNFHCSGYILGQHFIVMYYLHATAAEHIGGPDNERVADLCGDCQGLVKGAGHAGFRLRNIQLLHDPPELVPVLSHIYCGGRSTKYFYTCIGKFAGNIKWCLPAKLGYDPFRLFFFIDTQYIFYCQWLEIEFVRGVIICRYRLRVAVDHDGFYPFIPERKGRVNATVIKLNALAYPIGATAENHNFFSIAGRHSIRCIICGKIIGGILNAAHRHRLPCLSKAKGEALLPDFHFVDIQNLR